MYLAKVVSMGDIHTATKRCLRKEMNRVKTRHFG